MTEESQSFSPVSHIVGVPLGMNVDAADTLDLLSAAVAVEVVFTKDNTPSSLAVNNVQ